jgi:hypothetical protein
MMDIPLAVPSMWPRAGFRREEGHKRHARGDHDVGSHVLLTTADVCRKPL